VAPEKTRVQLMRLAGVDGPYRRAFGSMGRKAGAPEASASDARTSGACPLHGRGAQRTQVARRRTL